MEENKNFYSQMDSETRELLEVVAKVKIREEDENMEIVEAKYDLCKAFVDMALEGEHKYMIGAQQLAGTYDVDQIYKIFSSSEV